MAKLETINAEDLQNRTYEPTHFLADELIPEGLHILAGAPILQQRKARFCTLVSKIRSSVSRRGSLT